MPASRYTQQHFRDLAALLAAERDQNGPSPALNRITAAITQLFAENSARFNRELFGKAARGTVPVTTRPASLRSDRPERGIPLLPDVTPPPPVHDLASLNPADHPGWTVPVVTEVQEPSS